jgi:hypothetical protein
MEEISFNQATLCLPCHDIISLTNGEGGTWKELVAKAALLPRGWSELSALSLADRVEFTRLFWLSKWHFPLEKESFFQEKMDRFFKNLSNIEIFLVQHHAKSSYVPVMLYTLKKGHFFFASVPAQVQVVSRIAAQFSHFPLPEDYLSFFLIHDGFQRGEEAGMLSLRDLSSYYNRFRERFPSLDMMPFCEWEGVHHIQCFLSNRRGNINFDELSFTDRRLFFTTFSEWFFHYVYS